MRPRLVAALAALALAGILGACHLLLDITDPELASPSDAAVDAPAPAPDATATEIPIDAAIDADVGDAGPPDAQVPDGAVCEPRKVCRFNQVVDACTGRVFQTCSEGTFCCGDSRGARCVAPSLCDI